MKNTDDAWKSAADPCVGGKGPSQPHSAECFGEQRDFWWHRDFLDLMAARWGLRLHVLLGGGSEAFFESIFAELLENFRREQHSIAAGAFHAAGGAVTYLVSARKR